jgi:single-stranded-DNA-specific exonuclease
MRRVQIDVRQVDGKAAADLGRALGVSATFGQLLIHRGIQDPAAAKSYLEPRLSELSTPDAMADRGAAAERLAHAIRAGENITVFGDYDVDGTTSAAVLGGILEQLGGRVTVLLASRFDGGYGLSDVALERVLGTSPRILVTCDCGTSDHPRLEAARKRGVDCIVVDHHLVPSEPLPVHAFLNPHRLDCGFAYKGLCSAGLALSLGAAVRARLKAQIDLRLWLDLVALGTVADVAPLDGDNRRLVRAGLARLSAADARPGIAALREIAKISRGTPIGAGDIAFRLAPRLNAAGRLGDPMLSLNLLRAKEPEQARALAAQLEQRNEERKAIEAAVSADALTQVQALYAGSPRTGIVVAAEGWHRGVIGITAARLCDRFGVPAVAIAIEDGIGHGSCRGPEGVRTFDAMTACAAHFERFGGHQAASGLTIRAERIAAFREDFGTHTVRSEGDVARAIQHRVDVVVGSEVFALPTARELLLLEPVGEANREPVFMLERARVEHSSVVGRGHLKLGLRVGEQQLSAFGLDLGERLPAKGAVLDLVGALRIDNYRADGSLELRLADFAPSA